MSVLTSPVSLPDHAFAEVRLVAEKVSARSTSPYSLRSQVFVHPGQRWSAEVTLPIKKRADADAWIALLTEIAGGVGEIHLGDPARPAPNGAWGTSVTVDGANQTGQTLNVAGLDVSTTGVVKANDLFEVGSGLNRRLHQVVADADSDANGKAALKIWPRLRESPADGAAISVDNARGTFEIPKQEFGWTWQAPSMTVLSFRAVEAI